ncbi:hypothetical protein [Dyella acidisoli]|uniref:hypothetical protein n=1 Tax=Dyella acidisoli TaxID=1867834 RepID=UPI0024E0A4F0|nr:hypothetical protein [Dyella acidisoli]
MELFGTVSNNQLEVIIDKKRRTASQENILTRKYRRYEVLSATDAPSVMTDQTIQKIEKVVGTKTLLQFFRDHALWELLTEPLIPLERVRQIMTELPPILRARLFVQMDARDPQTWSRYPLKRDEVLEIRDERSLDALVALLALCREAQVIGHFPGHVLPMLCAFEILPWVLIANSWLRACWLDLFDCLKESFWSREYGGFTYSNDLNIKNMQIAMITVLRNNKDPHLPITGGRKHSK